VSLVQNHLTHRAGIEEKRRVKQEFERIQDDIRKGLRCEFHVPLETLPFVLGPQGSNLTQVRFDVL
jgi:hypothetical protein